MGGLARSHVSPLNAAWSMLKAIGDDWYEEDRPEWEEGDTANVYYGYDKFERPPITEEEQAWLNDEWEQYRNPARHFTDEERAHLLLQNRMEDEYGPSLDELFTQSTPMNDSYLEFSPKWRMSMAHDADEHAGRQALISNQDAIREAFNREYGQQ